MHFLAEYPFVIDEQIRGDLQIPVEVVDIDKGAVDLGNVLDEPLELGPVTL
jgi:hypothetical protein